MLDQSHFDTCFRIRTHAGIGSCFAHIAHNKKALVSAKHCLRNVARGESVYLDKGDDDWSKFTVSFIQEHTDHDVCVFRLDGFSFDWRRCSLSGYPCISEEHYIMGFPSFFKFPRSHSSGFATALIKKGIFMGWAQSWKSKIMLLDTINNKGFSGGPVFHLDTSSEFSNMHHLAHGRRYGEDYMGVKTIGYRPRLVAVVNGYQYDSKISGMVYKTQKSQETETEYHVKLNSGIMTCTHIEIVEKLIEETQFS